VCAHAHMCVRVCVCVCVTFSVVVFVDMTLQQSIEKCNVDFFKE